MLNKLIVYSFLLVMANAAICQPVRITHKSGLHAKGVVLLFDTAYTSSAEPWLVENGFDVAHVNIRVINSAAVKAFISFITDSHQHYKRVDVVGVGECGNLAAKLMQRLDSLQQPGSFLLISPGGMDETLPGTVIPAIMPPVIPRAELFINVKTEYAKTWIGYDGTALIDSNINTLKAAFIKGDKQQVTTINPAAVAVEGYSAKRHAEKLALVQKEKFNLVMLGNSITNNFEKPEYQPIWQQFFAPRHAINLGYSGYRTENILWNLQHGELVGQAPKVLVLEIGTNNIDEKNYPTRHTAGQLAGGIKAIVDLIKQKLPATKIIILRCFPGCYGGSNPTSHRAILERASEIVSSMADNKQVFYCDVNHVFLKPDGAINQRMMPDWLHPSPEGAKAWAEAMEPLLSQLMGDGARGGGGITNTAIVPVTKLEEDSYNWWDRHAEVLRIKDSVNPEIVLIGNSITHFWGGLPKLVNIKSEPRRPNGPAAWQSVFGSYRVLNLGFGWDRTQNVLWRLDHGELDNLHPRLVVIDIGTNNTSQTINARINTAAEIVEGIAAVVGRVRSKLPHAKIVVMAIFPREQDPHNPRRLLINDINTQLTAFTTQEHLTLLDIGPQMLRADGTFLPGMMLDFTHPTDKGYQVWANALRPFVEGD